MTAEELIRTCEERSIRLLPEEGGRLRVRSEGGTLTPELVEELRLKKNAVLLALLPKPETPEREPLPNPAAKAWRPEMAELIRWYRTCQNLPLTQFTLAPGVTVKEPCLFYAALEQDLADGPRGARGLYGALEQDLKRLRAMVEGIR